jgi:hypothetical protein
MYPELTACVDPVARYEYLAAEAERLEVAVEPARQLYDIGSRLVAPVIAGFADSAIERAAGRQMVCFARDGLGTYEIASQLLARCSDQYAVLPASTNLAYVNRKLVLNEGPAVVCRYLECIGVDTRSAILVVDIGVYGTIIPMMRPVLPDAEYYYLLSVKDDINGYAHHPSRPPMSNVCHPDNEWPLYFLEDPFCGLERSPHRLRQDVAGMWLPDFESSPYPPFSPHERLCRVAAFLSLRDYAAGLTRRPDQPSEAAIRRLNNFLGVVANFADIATAVPHERSTFQNA